MHEPTNALYKFETVKTVLVTLIVEMRPPKRSVVSVGWLDREQADEIP